MFAFAVVAALVALALEVPLSAKAGAVKQEVLALAPEYGRTVFQRSRVWEVITSGRTRFSILVLRPPGLVARLMSPVRRLAMLQFSFSLATVVLLLAAVEA